MSERKLFGWSQKDNKGKSGSLKRCVPRVLPFRQPDKQSGLNDAGLNDVESLKFIYAIWVRDHPIGGKQMTRLENALKAGRFAFLPENLVEHWGMEEYLWHGMPNHDWDPIEAFLAAKGQGFSEKGREQFRYWREMKIGFYEIGQVERDTVEMWAWDHLAQTRRGDSFQAVSCGIGGVNFYREYAGDLMLTYVSPWQPDRNIYCTGGYGSIVKKNDLKAEELWLGLSRPDILIQPLEFGFGSRNLPTRKLRETWKSRNWQSWLKERLDFPFRALVTVPTIKSMYPVQVTAVIEMTAEETRRKGVYFHTDGGDILDVVGGSAMIVADVISPNFLLLLEYGAYREWAGPPPEAPRSGLSFIKSFPKR